MKIIGIGNALVDIVCEIPSDETLIRLGLPKGSMTLVDEEKHTLLLKVINSLEQTVAAGGSAANTINGLAKLGTSTAFIGKISDNDQTGQLFKNDQQTNGIKPLLLTTNEVHTGKCISFVSPDKERTMATFLGAASTLTPQEVIVPECQILYVEGYLLYNHDLIEAIMRQAKENGVKVAIDLASYNVVADNRDFLKDLIRRYVDIIFANEDEAKEYTGMDAEGALDLLSQEAEIAVVKIGPKGSLVARGEERYKIGVIEATPRDKTGAGDLYAAGFLYGLTNGYDLKKCGDIGAILSSKVVEVMGPKMDDNTWTEIKRLVTRIENGENIVNIF